MQPGVFRCLPIATSLRETASLSQACVFLEEVKHAFNSLQFLKIENFSHQVSNNERVLPSCRLTIHQVTWYNKVRKLSIHNSYYLLNKEA